MVRQRNTDVLTDPNRCGGRVGNFLPRFRGLSPFHERGEDTNLAFTLFKLSVGAADGGSSRRFQPLKIGVDLLSFVRVHQLGDRGSPHTPADLPSLTVPGKRGCSVAAFVLRASVNKAEVSHDTKCWTCPDLESVFKSTWQSRYQGVDVVCSPVMQRLVALRENQVDGGGTSSSTSPVDRRRP